MAYDMDWLLSMIKDSEFILNDPNGEKLSKFLVGVTTQSRLHNTIAPGIVNLIVRSTASLGGTGGNALVILESIYIGVLVYAAAEGATRNNADPNMIHKYPIEKVRRIVRKSMGDAITKLISEAGKSQ